MSHESYTENAYAFPWGDVVLERYAHEYPESKYGPQIKKILEVFLKQELENISLFVSADGTAFPFTSVSVRRLALDLQHETQTAILPSAPKRVEFVMGSFLNNKHGHPFNFCQQAMHRVIQELPKALRALESGEHYADSVVYTLGSPTYETGVLSDAFAGHVKKRPFEALGTLYAEFVEDEGSKIPAGSHLPEIILTGFSMGGNFAVETARALIEKGIVSQDRTVSRVPHLEVNAYIPAGLDRSPLKFLKLPAGIFIEWFIQKHILKNPSLEIIRNGTDDFTERLSKAFYQKNILVTEDVSQKKHKKTAMRAILRDLVFQNFDLPSGLKINKISGLKDPMTFSAPHAREFRKDKLNRSGTLGAQILQRRSFGAREFAVDMSHRVPFYRSSEMRLWHRAGEALAYRFDLQEPAG